jgi:hypothetical protein
MRICVRYSVGIMYKLYVFMQLLKYSVGINYRMYVCKWQRSYEAKRLVELSGALTKPLIHALSKRLLHTYSNAE